MRAVMSVPTRLIGENSRSVHPGDIVEGAEAAEQVALGHAEALSEAPVVPTEPEEAPAEAETPEVPDVPESPVEAPAEGV